MSDQVFDPTRMSIDEQAAYLLEGSYFADEGGEKTQDELLYDQYTREFGLLHNKLNIQPSEDEQTRYKVLGAELARLREQLPDRSNKLRPQMAGELKAKLTHAANLRAKGDPSWPLRVYLGVDPTRESLHIGHMVPVVNLRRFQRLGHQVIFLIGDYTATIGDPSGASSERPQLTHERVLELAKFYTDQAFRLLHPEPKDVIYPGGKLTELGVEVRHNGDWLADLRFAQLAELMSLFPVKQVLARDDFRQRLESGEGLRAHELLYAFMQGYDAFALNCDVQAGGYDQHFNLLAGRVIQEHFQKKLRSQQHPLLGASRPKHPHTGREVKGPHVMVTNPLLMGTDGRKMSKSLGNTIDVLDAPQDIYGKVMRISDEMIAHYIDIAVEAPLAVKQAMKARGADDPMGVKKWIAQRITELYCGPEAADEAAGHFQRTVQDKQIAESDILERPVPEVLAHGCRLADLLVLLGLAASKAEVQRLIEQGGVKLNGAVLKDKFADYSHVPGTLLQIGKRKIVRLT